MKHPRKQPFSFILIALVMNGSILAACGPISNSAASVTPGTNCGNGFCDSGETSLSCASDCPAGSFSGKIQSTHINSAGVGDIAVMVASPKGARYPEGAGVVVVVSPIFSGSTSFMTDPDVASLGLIQVSFMWPGQTDSLTSSRSTGTFDSGGEQSVQVLRDVIRFASGTIPDVDGKFISSVTQVAPLTGEVGLYAFSDAGIEVINVLKLYGDQLSKVQYYVGQENPTVDTLSCLEAGYVDDNGQPVYNPFYSYPVSYSTSAINFSYANVRWDATYTEPRTGAVGRAYLDLDGNGSLSSGDYVTSWKVPIIFGKRTYSAALTQALLDTGSLSLSDWPADLATPEEAARDWQFRQSINQYIDLRTLMPNLKVMLVFAQVDHAQAAKDKPHIHQAYQGFRFEAGLWVRLNPDRVYIQSIIPNAGNEFPDNPANTGPSDWAQIGKYAYPGQGAASDLVPLAAVAEMADRAHFNRWDENLGQVLYIYFPTPTLP